MKIVIDNDMKCNLNCCLCEYSVTLTGKDDDIDKDRIDDFLHHANECHPSLLHRFKYSALEYQCELCGIRLLVKNEDLIDEHYKEHHTVCKDQQPIVKYGGITRPYCKAICNMFYECKEKRVEYNTKRSATEAYTQCAKYFEECRLRYKNAIDRAIKKKVALYFRHNELLMKSLK